MAAPLLPLRTPRRQPFTTAVAPLSPFGRRGGGGGAVARAVSGSIRCHTPTVTATASGSLCFVFRSDDASVVSCANPVVRIWNGYSLGTGSHGVAAETNTGAPLSVRYAVVTNLNGVGANQTGATLWQATFFGMLLNAAFIAAGGTVSGDGLTVTIPDGYTADTDPITGLMLQPLVRYYHQIEEVYQSGQLRITGDNGAATYGDMRWTQASNVGSPVYQLDWSVKWGNNFPTSISGGSAKWPLAVIGTGNGAPRSRIVAVEGDSINNGGNTYLGPNGERSTVKTALIAQGYNYVSPAASGSNITDMKLYGGYAVRMGLVSGAYAVITDHGHNDRGAAAVPNTSFETAMLANIRWHNQLLRSYAHSGAPIIRTTLLPHATSTNLWVDLAGQTGYSTPADGPSGWVNGYANYLMRRGAYAGVPFDIASGDPDGAWDFFTAIGASLTDYKWPVNGTAQWGTNDGTHPNGPIITPAAADLAPRLLSLLGF